MHNMASLISENIDSLLVDEASLNSKSMSSFFSGNVEILAVAETKLDVSFATAQFLIPSFHHPF